MLKEESQFLSASNSLGTHSEAHIYGNPALPHPEFNHRMYLLPNRLSRSY